MSQGTYEQLKRLADAAENIAAILASKVVVRAASMYHPAAHPAPPEAVDDSPPFTPEAAKDFAARGFERVNRPAPPAVASGDGDDLWTIVGGILGAEGFDQCERRDRIIAQAVRAAVLRELTLDELRKLGRTMAARIEAGATDVKVVEWVLREADAIRSRGPGGAT